MTERSAVKQIDSRTVEFTTVGEQQAHDRFNEALDEGHSIRAAATLALEEGLSKRWRFSREFVEYLSEDTVLVTRTRRVVPTAKGRQYP